MHQATKHLKHVTIPSYLQSLKTVSAIQEINRDSEHLRKPTIHNTWPDNLKNEKTNMKND